MKSTFRKFVVQPIEDGYSFHEIMVDNYQFQKGEIFLSLEEQKLSTRFCMEKEEMIDFIEQHIDQLNERLVKRGYQVTTAVTASTKEEEKTVIDEIMTTENAIPIMTSQSFDARC